ncbi:hypothetical protein [Luteimonas huabeiensis]|uniref:hypothetical protein n=1 Tax=Luteimonas huabeiensis TaxID=1244513 RepID=UPI0004BAD6A9|nr:hypothetical protein [Luteimonas huabeiensis]
MTAHRVNDIEPAAQTAFDGKQYLLGRYGMRMNKKEVCFESKKSRATIDNLRNPRHKSFDRLLADAEVCLGGKGENGVPVLFHTVRIAEWLDGPAMAGTQ